MSKVDMSGDLDFDNICKLYIHQKIKKMKIYR